MAISKTTKILLVLGGILAAMVIVVIAGLIYLSRTMGQPSVASNSVLILNVAGDLPDYIAEDPVAKAFGIRQPQSFTSLLTQLRKAKVDNRIGAVKLDIDFPSIGWAKADELRDAIKEFRSSGKPVYAYMEMGTNLEYYIASAADRIYLPPAGFIFINGFAAEAMFYKGSLDKLGIELETIQIGPKYKNAPDQYTKKEMGEGQREVINAILDEYMTRYTNGIAESRKKSIEEVKAIIDNAPYSAMQAKNLGLIDDALFPDQIEQELKATLGYKESDKLRTVRGSDYRDVPSDSLGLNSGEKIAIIFASGVINTGRSSTGFRGEMVGSDTVVSAINDAAADKSVKAIVLRVDSPGGSALASDLMWGAIEKAKEQKPVVVSMSDVGASGGYYISAGANKIIAEPSTVTGSIGVFMGKPVVKGLYDWLGITNEYVLRGKNAGLFRLTEKWTADERAKMIEMTNSIYYDDFLPKVAKGRRMTTEEVNAIGQGRVWTGTQAKANGLIDDFGGLEKAISVAMELAGLPTDKDPRRVVFPEPQPFFEMLFDQIDSTSSSEEKAKAEFFKSLPLDVQRAFRYIALFESMENGKAMLLMPFELKIK